MSFKKCFSINPRINTTIYSTVLLLGIYLGKTESKRHMCLSVHCSIVYNSQVVEATDRCVYRCPLIDEWI